MMKLDTLELENFFLFVQFKKSGTIIIFTNQIFLRNAERNFEKWKFF